MPRRLSNIPQSHTVTETCPSQSWCRYLVNSIIVERLTISSSYAHLFRQLTCVVQMRRISFADKRGFAGEVQHIGPLFQPSTTASHFLPSFFLAQQTPPLQSHVSSPLLT